MFYFIKKNKGKIEQYHFFTEYAFYIIDMISMINDMIKNKRFKLMDIGLIIHHLVPFTSYPLY